MAGVAFSVTRSGMGLTAATEQTIMQILAGTNHRLLVHAIDVSFNGVTPTNEPVLVQLLFQSSAGTGGNAVTPVKLNPSDDETLIVTALGGIWATTEPTDGNIVGSYYVHPQTGRPFIIPLRAPIIVPGGSRFAIDCTAPNGVNASCNIWGEE